MTPVASNGSLLQPDRVGFASSACLELTNLNLPTACDLAEGAL